MSPMQSGTTINVIKIALTQWSHNWPTLQKLRLGVN